MEKRGFPSLKVILGVPDEQPPPPDLDPRLALAEIDGASGPMVNSTEGPRGFMLAAVLIVLTILALGTCS